MKCSFIAILAIGFCVLGNTKACSGNWNLLDGSPWNVTVTENSTKLYQISLCRPLKYDSLPGKNCDGSSICLFEGGIARSIAKFSSFNDLLKTNIFRTVVLSGSCLDSLPSAIFFQCGENLNYPKLLFEANCSANFIWTTLAACHKPSKRKEVRCHVYDDANKIKDLTPLIKNKGGYAVSSTDIGVEFFINVCSDIISDGDTEGCPPGASACRKIGSEVLTFGGPDTGVFSSGSDVKIVYNSINATIPAGCDMPPRTTITFRCPPKGRNHAPRIIANSNCQYEIEWQTEYSCSRETVMTDLKSCKFTREQHGVDLDLSPLKKSGGYHLVQHIHNDTFTFNLNVCGGLGEQKTCKGWRSTTVCMNDTTIGSMSGATLSYSDGEVKLIYFSSAPCQNKINNFIKTIIEFHCEANAGENGLGSPEFIGEEDCVYLFKWKTKYACPKHPLGNSCYVDYENIHIDLGVLIKNSDEKPWQVVNTSGRNNDTFYLNVCGDIPKKFNGSNCESGAGLCKTNSSGSSVNYGMFTSPPTYNKQFKTVHMTYTEGDSCGNGGQQETLINFICKPGVLDSPPVLERISEDGCRATVRWHTAAACPQATKKGSDCKVYDEDLGLTFDLNPLKKATYYEVKAKNYTYFLNVCDKVKGTRCDITDGSQNAAACLDGITAVKLGEPNSELLYMDGMISLTYKLGTPYNKTPRTTSITFLCDKSAGEGHPEFLEQAHHAYSFRWYTSYACPKDVAVECFVQNPHNNEQYDLSRLTKAEGKPNWMVTSGTGSEAKKFYLNICRPLTSEGTHCSPHAAACLVDVDKSKGSQVITNIGQALQRPEIKSNGHLQLVYKDGDPCVAFGKNTTYSTTIQFLCAESQDEVMYLNKLGSCEHLFLWQTAAACPVKKMESENECSINDTVTGVTYNFTHLKTKYYEVTFGGRKFQVNICGTVSGGCQGSNEANNVTACEIDEKGNLKKVIGTLNKYSLQISEDKVITLVYNGTYDQSTGAVTKVYITFKCDRLGKDSNLVFKQEVNSVEYYFEMSTPAACSSELSDCSFTDSSGNRYDLTPLIKRGGSNWEVVDNREVHSDIRYHINFCLPVNPTEEYSCPAGAVGACQTSALNVDEGLVLGYFNQTPIINDGKVVVVYSDGSPCHDGQFIRSTVIILRCSSKQSDLVFVSESPECSYFFSMDTPAACPLEGKDGDDCSVTVPNFGYRFDLSSLRQKTGRYEVKHGEYEYILNVCGAIIDPPPTCSGSGVCQTKIHDSNFAVDAGKASSKLRYDNGVVQLVYENGKGNCHGKYNRSTVLSFMCNPHMSKELEAPVFLSEEEDCTYHFEWQTSLMCHEQELQECSVSSNSEHYDLNSLSHFPYEIPYSRNKHAAISICRSLSSKRYGSACSLNSAACIVEFDRNGYVTKGTNIGNVGSPYLENGILKLQYTHGDNCEFLDGTRKLRTIIEFECDKQSWKTVPELVANENCTYYFTWRHRAACPIPPETSVNDNCTAVNPVTGFVFNLSPLKHANFYRVTNNKHEYNINVCAAVKDNSCAEKSGSCQQDSDRSRKWNAGNYNSRLHFHENSLILNYTGGDTCHRIYNRNTIIQFTCGIGNGHPTFISESNDCTYYFSWSTVYACEDRVRCVVENGSQIIDLSSLSLEEGYHTAVDVKTNDKYFINVCGPLINVNPLCSDSGVCHIGNSVESLGQPHGPPFIDFEGYVTVIYTDGSPCHNGENKNSTSRIIFSCNPNAGSGEPILRIKDDSLCHYLFYWETSLVCPERISPPISDCKFIDANRNIEIDLSLLKRINSSYEVKGKRDDEKFTLNICGPSESGILDCSNAGVCFHGMADKENFGSSNSATFSYSGEELTLTYDEGGDCPLSETGKRSSRILFSCDRKAGKGNPVLYKQSSCIAVFKWKTNVVCVDKSPECTFWMNDKFYDLRLLSSVTHSWNMSDSNGNIYWLNVCKSTNIDFGLENCQNSGVCMKHSNGTYFSLGTLYSWTLNSTDSGDISLTYGDGDKVCSGMTAASNIKFICGKTMSQPRFISGPSSSCTFDFIWETSVACAETRKELLPRDKNKIFDSRLGYSFDMSSLFNKTYSIEWNGSDDSYIFVINLSGVKSAATTNDCDDAAVCQTKPDSFYRDIGTVSTERFYLKGNDLQLELTSYGRKCGKNKDKNVTTIFYFVCVSEMGVGRPTFFYESGNCDYLFNWETDLVCPNNNRISDALNVTPKDNVDIKQVDKSSSSYVVQVVIAIILSASLVALILFIVSKEERRDAIRRKLNNAFINVHLPRLCYRRGNSETLLLSSPAVVHGHDESDVEILA